MTSYRWVNQTHENTEKINILQQQFSEINYGMYIPMIEYNKVYP